MVGQLTSSTQSLLSSSQSLGTVPSVRLTGNAIPVTILWCYISTILLLFDIWRKQEFIIFLRFVDSMEVVKCSPEARVLVGMAETHAGGLLNRFITNYYDYYTTIIDHLK